MELPNNKTISQILAKLNINELNAMQNEAFQAISSKNDVVLLSPTGSGKTLAFLLPIISLLDSKSTNIQVLILVPSRELAMQIEQVAHNIGSGFKTNVVYGGRAFSKDKMELKHPPAILIGTPGRIAEHIRRETIDVDAVKTLIIDEFDKCLEVGFEGEMKEIIYNLRSLSKRVLTSATQKTEIPSFVGMHTPATINNLKNQTTELSQKLIESTDKLQTLVNLLKNIGKGNGIIFCNFKDSIQTVSDFLNKNAIKHGCFYGGLEQLDREMALLKFRNGTHRLLLATDLAARGIDVPEMDFIIHFQLPPKEDEFIHRNGRTARMNQQGTAYIIKAAEEQLPEFIKLATPTTLGAGSPFVDTPWETLHISGGRKDKISKGDIAGLFIKQGKLNNNELGVIELKQDCSYVSVPAKKVNEIINQLNNAKLKTKKVRIRQI